MTNPAPHPLTYRQGTLFLEDVSLTALAQTVGTPLYVYSQADILAAYARYASAFADRTALICFAMKANYNPSLLRLLAKAGAGADVVSFNEMRVALHAGIPADKVVFSGVGKTDDELRQALQAGIKQINAESKAEVLRLNSIAASLGVTARIGLRINPDVDAETHAKITTGKKGNKFGMAPEEALRLLQDHNLYPNLDFASIAVHIGSQLTKLDPFAAAYRRVVTFVEDAKSTGAPLRCLDLGGGLGVSYTGEQIPSLDAYADMVKECTDSLTVAENFELIFEPGRSLVALAGVLITQVVYTKESLGERFAVVDCGMNDFMRPALYDSVHQLIPLQEMAADTPRHPTHVVGPVCESSDVFARDLPLPDLDSGALLALHGVGAYGTVLASHYNCRQSPPEVLVDGASYAVIKERQSFEDLLRLYPETPVWQE